MARPKKVVRRKRTAKVAQAPPENEVVIETSEGPMVVKTEVLQQLPKENSPEAVKLEAELLQQLAEREKVVATPEPDKVVTKAPPNPKSKPAVSLGFGLAWVGVIALGVGGIAALLYGYYAKINPVAMAGAVAMASGGLLGFTKLKPDALNSGTGTAQPDMISLPPVPGITINENPQVVGPQVKSYQTDKDGKQLLDKKGKPVAVVANSLNIYPSTGGFQGRVVFEFVENPTGFKKRCLNNGKYYFIHRWDVKDKMLRPFILPDTQYYSPREFGNVVEMPANRRFFRRKANLWEHLSMWALPVVILILAFLLIATSPPPATP